MLKDIGMTVCFVVQTLMEAMGLIAIIVNCYLIGQCGQLQRLFPWLSPEMAIISIVILEVNMLTTYPRVALFHKLVVISSNIFYYIVYFFVLCSTLLSY